MYVCSLAHINFTVYFCSLSHLGQIVVDVVRSTKETGNTYDNGIWNEILVKKHVKIKLKK